MNISFISLGRLVKPPKGRGGGGGGGGTDTNQYQWHLEASGRGYFVKVGCAKVNWYPKSECY